MDTSARLDLKQKGISKASGTNPKLDMIRLQLQRRREIDARANAKKQAKNMILQAKDKAKNIIAQAKDKALMVKAGQRRKRVDTS